MKNVLVFLIAISLFLFPGCQKENSLSSSVPSKTPNLLAVISDMGATLHNLQLQHPSYEFLHFPGYDFSAECLGSPEGTLAYVFFGTQSGPSLEEMAPQYGEQLKCAGIYTTVDEVFAIANNEAVSIEDFLFSIDININDSDRVHFWSGWVLFEYMKYSMALNTGDIGDTDSGIYNMPTVKIQKDFPLIIMDEALWSSNEKLCDDFLKANDDY